MILSKMVGAPLSAWAALQQSRAGPRSEAAEQRRWRRRQLGHPPSAPSQPRSHPDRCLDRSTTACSGAGAAAAATQFRPAHSRSLRPLHLAGHGPDCQLPAVGGHPTAQVGAAEPCSSACCRCRSAAAGEQLDALQHRCDGRPDRRLQQLGGRGQSAAGSAERLVFAACRLGRARHAALPYRVIAAHVTSVHEAGMRRRSGRALLGGRLGAAPAAPQAPEGCDMQPRAQAAGQQRPARPHALLWCAAAGAACARLRRRCLQLAHRGHTSFPLANSPASQAPCCLGRARHRMWRSGC